MATSGKHHYLEVRARSNVQTNLNIFVFSSIYLLFIQIYIFQNTRQDIFGRAYVWLIMGSYSQLWWNHTDLDCSIEQIEVALESVIIAELLPLSTSGDITVSGIVSIFREIYHTYR